VPAKTPNPVDVHVGQRIRMRRVERKMTTETLGNAVGVTFQQIQKYETGANRAGASRLQQICTVLDVPVSYLFKGAPGSPPRKSGMPQDIIDFMASPDGVRVAEAFGRITDLSLRRSIVRLASRIADGM